jgi:endonuclease-8
MNFYACSVKFLEGDINQYYDWNADVLSDAWDADAAKEKLLKAPHMLACDALLDQNIFAGVGNIIKNEVLWRIQVHPLSTVGALPPEQFDAFIFEARNYSFDFLRWKRQYVLRKHYQVHTKKICPRDGAKLLLKHLGKTNRRTFYCEVCQVLYNDQ